MICLASKLTRSGHLKQTTCLVGSLLKTKLSTEQTSIVKEKSEQQDQAMVVQTKQTFAQMFRKSKFVSLGNLENKILIGKIFDIVGDDLYIDYGGKFNAVCKRPYNKNYKRNDNVLIKLLDFEMASFFLSAAKHLTLLESNAIIVGPHGAADANGDERVVQLNKEIDELNSEPYY